MYDDMNATCLKTYATFRIYPGDLDPSSVTEQLGIEPSEWQRKGEPFRSASFATKAAELNGWFLHSKGHVDSRDSRRHVDWLLDQLVPKQDAIRSLQQAGCKMDISCYWLSAEGHGGPTLSPLQMGKLALLNIELGFDVYG